MCSLRDEYTSGHVLLASLASLRLVAGGLRLHDVNTCSYLLVLVFGGYRSSALLPPLGFCIFHKLRFLRFQEFFFFPPYSLKKPKLGVWGGVEMRTHPFNFCSRFGPPHVPVLDLVPDIVYFYCNIQLFCTQPGMKQLLYFYLVAVFTLLYSIHTATSPMSLFLSPFLT